MKRTNILIILILVIHYCFINGLEKMTISTFFDYKSLRPLPECNTKNVTISCLGLPSAHVEMATILGAYLYSTKYISFFWCIALIVVTCFQIILTKSHTLLQTLVGILFGGAYFYLYSLTSHKIFLSVFFVFLYSSILIINLNHLLSEKIPVWVDKKMLSTIDKKKKVPYYFKFISLNIVCLKQHFTLFMSWKELEYYLDIILDKIKKTGIQFDSVVGIKTGGAILSDYISYKLGIKNYKIKVSEKAYNCNKGPTDFIDQYVNRHVLKKSSDYMICEGIEDDISGKNVILIDEMVYTGETMNKCIEYLKSKQANIYPTTIYSSIDSLRGLIKFENLPVVWPWGYDN